jgi:hypothetical protein
MKFRVLWDVAPCSRVEVDVSEVPTTTIIRAIIAVTARHYIPEDTKLRQSTLPLCSNP